MTAVCSVHTNLSVRSDVVLRLADHLRQYPEDIVDTKRLLKRFQASDDEFQLALRRIDVTVTVPEGPGNTAG